ncbi:MAG: endonuclease/exonuclease/phosphatase family protein [Deltaproteobacteria bacterium]|nr:endonuclease/exonuclease/phosphatase family protein [Deltaproteobacteria bacterium]
MKLAIGILFLCILGCGDEDSGSSSSDSTSPSTDESTSESNQDSSDSVSDTTTTSGSTSSNGTSSKTSNNTSDSNSTTQSSNNTTSETGPNSVSLSLKIAAFNADILGVTKMGNSTVASYIADIVARYDIILVQEIRDVSLETPSDLLDLVNAKGKGTYAVSVSDRLGRTSSKEQYAFYYKTESALSVSTSYVFVDSDDVFEREPYIVQFSKDSYSFGLIGIHVKPTDAVSELNFLDDVYSSASTSHPSDDWIILGDLNADCSYLSDAKYNALDISSTAGFVWNIAKDLDTTVSSTDCAYDNIISKTTNVKNAGIFDFKTFFGIDQATAEEISNHYPVEFTLEIKK